MANYSIEVEAGKYVFREGDLGTDMYIIQKGSVAISKRLGGQETQLALLDQGDFFGEMSVLEDLPRSASARAVTDCRLLQINGTIFDQMLRKNPEIAVRMMRKLSRRLRETDGLLRRALGSDESMAPEMPSPEPTETVGRGPERLVHESTGSEFHLSGAAETTVGRRDPVTGIHPDVDLGSADTQRSISRRHAKILRREEGRYEVLEEIGTMNGTFVNGERVETGIPVEFRDGDEVRFGLVKLQFHAR